MQAQPEIPPADEKHSSAWPAWFGWSVTLFVIYALSIGPMVGLVRRGSLPQNTRAFKLLQNFYGPLQWLHDKTPLREPLDLYVDLWGPDNPQKK